MCELVEAVLDCVAKIQLVRCVMVMFHVQLCD